MKKLLKRLLIFILVLIILVVGVLVGGYFYVKTTYDIDLIKTIGELKTLSEPVDETKIAPNAYSDADMVNVKDIINESTKNFITYTEENGYYVNFDEVPSEMKKIIKLSDKQIAAISQTIIDQELNGEIKIGSTSAKIKIMQVDIYKSTTGENMLNSIISIDLANVIKQIPETFPFTLIKEKIPKTLYISSTVIVSSGIQPFSYTILHDTFTINNLTPEQTDDMFHTLDVLMKIGDDKDLNIKIGQTLMDALVGSPTANGIAYALKDKGASGYEFTNENGTDYFVILR